MKIIRALINKIIFPTISVIIVGFVNSIYRWLHYTIIVCPWGIGDTLFILLCLGSYKESEKKGKVAIICKKYTGQICRFFRSVDCVLPNDFICKAFMTYNTILGRRKKTYLFAHIDQVNLPQYNSIIERYGYGILNLMSIRQLDYPDLREVIIPSYWNKENKQYCIVSPFAKTKSQAPSLAFWEGIITALIQYGFEVYTNCGNRNEMELPGTKRLEVSLGELFLIAEKSEAFIAYRSGVCDWIALSNTNMYIINDPMWGKEWDLNNYSKKEVHYYHFEQKREIEIANTLLMDIFNE